MALAQTAVTKAKVIRIIATIQAIDPTTRSTTLRDDKGVEDKINITYTQSFLTSVQNAN